MLTRKFDGDTTLYLSGDKVVLSMEEIISEEGVLVNLVGELRREVSHDLQDELWAFATSGASVVLDFSKVEYIANSVQDALVVVQQKIEAMHKGSMVLKSLPEKIMREFEGTGIIDCLEFAE